MSAWAGVAQAGLDFASAKMTAKSASKSRSWQKYLARHGVEMRVNDLRAAGLNPILAASGGGVGAASSNPTSTANFDLGDSPTVAATVAQIKAQTRKVEEETKGQEQVNTIRKPAVDAAIVAGEVSEDVKTQGVDLYNKGKNYIDSKLNPPAKKPVSSARQQWREDRKMNKEAKEYAERLLRRKRAAQKRGNKLNR